MFNYLVALIDVNEDGEGAGGGDSEAKIFRKLVRVVAVVTLKQKITRLKTS